MAYGDNTLNADHRWSFNNVLTDSIGALTIANTGTTFVTSPLLTKDATHSLRTDGRDELCTVATTTDTGSAGFNRYAFQGWFRVSQIQGPPTLIYKQGGATGGFAIFLWAGNNVMVQSINNAGNTLMQIFSDIALTDNRTYHFFIRFSGNGFSNEFEFYLDGVKQTSNLDGVNPNTANMVAHTGSHTWGENGASSIDTPVGSENVLVKAPVNGYWSEWWTWEGADAEAITETQINDDLFGAGAIPETTITAGTEAAMQAQLDTYIGTTRGDQPLNFLVEEVTGGGDLNLTALNIQHDPRASIHVRYEGTGTLSWTNNGTSNADRSSGNVTFVNPATATFNGLIVGGEFRLYEYNGTNDHGPELDGIETLVADSFQYNHSGNTQQIVIQHIADPIKEIKLVRTLNASDQTFTLRPEIDTND